MVARVDLPMGLGVLEALADHGLSVPEEVAIVVCEDVPMAARLRPSLTSVSSDLAAYGRRAVETLLSAVAGQEVAPVAEMAHTLVVRQSSPR